MTETTAPAAETAETAAPAKPTTCSTEGCDKAIYSKGLCRKHYEAAKENDLSRGHCSVDGCDRGIYVKGMCRKHYTSNRNKGLSKSTRLSEDERALLAEAVERLAKREPKSDLVAKAREILGVTAV